MRTLRAIGIGLAVLAGGESIARAQGGGGINFVELFQQLDANGDLVIEKGEIPESGRLAFERLLKNADTNHDGKIDQQEYRDTLREVRESGLVGMGGGGASLRTRLVTMDRDGDGKVSRAEFQGRPAMFERLDADGDGFVTKDEAAKVIAGLEGSPAERIKVMDRDGDGKVSRAEFLGVPARFDVIDTDKDGFVTVDELISAQGAAAKTAPKEASEKPAK